jgi:hypothetical protein
MERSKTSDGDQRNASKSRSVMPTNLLEKVVQGRLLLRILKLPISGIRDAGCEHKCGHAMVLRVHGLPDQLPSRHFHAATG